MRGKYPHRDQFNANFQFFLTEKILEMKKLLGKKFSSIRSLIAQHIQSVLYEAGSTSCNRFMAIRLGLMVTDLVQS